MQILLSVRYKHRMYLAGKYVPALISRKEETSAFLGFLQALCPNKLSKLKQMTGSVGTQLACREDWIN